MSNKLFSVLSSMLILSGCVHVAENLQATQNTAPVPVAQAEELPVFTATQEQPAVETQSSDSVEPAPALEELPDVVETSDNGLAFVGQAEVQTEVIDQANDESLAVQGALDKAFSGTQDTEDDTALQPKDLWQRIRAGFTLQHDHPGVQRDLQWFRANQEYLDRVVERARPFLHMIVEEVVKREMPLEIALLPVVESAFQTFAYSHGRAAGIWQFIPGTGRIYGLRQNWWYDGRRDVWASTQAALEYLGALHRKFNDWELALAAYNSGSGTVKKAIRINTRKGRATDFWSLRRNLPRETRGYVPKLLAISAIVANPEQHGIELEAIDDEPYLGRVELPGQMDLALVAELAGLSIDRVYELNAAFNRWATEPNHQNHILLPLEAEEKFRLGLAQLPAEERIQWQRHRIRKGESIGQIARKYNTTVSVIKKVNKLRGNTIRQGRSLIIPVAMKDEDYYTHTAGNRKQKIQNTARSGRLKQIYMVRAGDSFWTISRKFDVGMRALAKWNGMAPRDKLKPGQKLVIWIKRSTEKLTSVDTSRMIKPPTSQTKRWIKYRVRRGDSLARIAGKFNVTVNQILNWNERFKGKKYLQPGQRLKLYVDVTRQG